MCVSYLFLLLFFAARSSTAAALARHYGGTCLSVDGVVTDVLMNGTSPLSLTARQLYDCAASQYAKRKAGEAGKHAEILCMHCYCRNTKQCPLALR